MMIVALYGIDGSQYLLRHVLTNIVPDAITVQSTKSSEHTGTNLTSDVELVYRVTTAGCQRQVQDRWNEAFADFQQKNKAQI